MRDFYDLTELGKSRRLRVLADMALEKYAIDITNVSLLSNDWNGVWRVDANDGGPYVLRVARADSGHPVSHMEAEMEYLEAIAADSAIVAPRPVRTRSGAWTVTASATGVPEPRHCCLFSWVPGVDLAERPTVENWAALGALSASLHSFGAAFDRPDGFEIFANDSPFAFDEKCVLFEEPHVDRFLPADQADLRYALDVIQKDIDLLHSGSDLMVTHGDLHHWNVKVARGVLYPIDFEDLFFQHPVQDIGITFYAIRRHERFEELGPAFRKGYETVRPWPEQFEGQVELHTLARRFNLVNYVLYSKEENADDYPDMIPAFLDRTRSVMAALSGGT